MAKSAGNIIRVSDLPAKGFEPLEFRYLALTAHYRSKLDFSQDAMHAAASGLARLRRATSGTDADGSPVDLSSEPMAGYRARFVEAISEDLAMPSALAVAHGVAGADDLTPPQRRALLRDFDRVLGLDLARAEPAQAPLPAGAPELLERREAARSARDFTASDALRDELAALGVEVRDTPEGQVPSVRR
jgi:cysteinyl-tRNA synthetase